MYCDENISDSGIAKVCFTVKLDFTLYIICILKMDSYIYLYEMLLFFYKMLIMEFIPKNSYVDFQDIELEFTNNIICF